MTQQVMLALGGLGLFLFGMVVMTDGLNRLAGPALHRWLVSFTRSPVTGAVTGTVATAVLQSSSATTVATVGFVAAGLLTFTQALGIVFGANLGTTITGWLVALFGFKLELGQLALPGVLIGALLSLLGRGHWQTLGRVIAGFAVLFLGIEFMKDGMAVFGDLLTPSRFPPDHLGSRLLLVGLGALLTLLTQSSSAGVALAMTALSLGSLNFAQAACLVIGMDVGTTITAVLASIGRSAAAWRTGLSHTIYNVATAVIALALLDAYVFGLDTLLPGALQDDQELALVGFHTLFNAVALVFGLLLARPFSRFMAWLVPVRTQDLTWRLDDALLAEPAAANAALAATLADVFHRLLSWQRHALGPAAGPALVRGRRPVSPPRHRAGGTA
jgi:phosphate:Na+ symporter